MREQIITVNNRQTERGRESEEGASLKKIKSVALMCGSGLQMDIISNGSAGTESAWIRSWRLARLVIAVLHVCGFIDT